MKKKNKQPKTRWYIVYWTEQHSKGVLASSEKDAIEQVNLGYGSDETASVEGGFEACILKN